MVFGNIFEVFEDTYNPINESTQEVKKQSGISRILTSLSRYGMNYNKDIIRNMQAIPADKKLVNKDDYLLNQSLYGGVLQNWKNKQEEEKSFKEKGIEQKREVLRNIAQQPEIEDILDIMANECIVYDDEEAYICQPFIDNAVVQDLNEQSLNEIRTCVDTSFYKIYMLLNWKESAWDIFRRYLVDGIIAYEIIYDNLENPHSIIGIIDLDPNTLTKTVKNGVTYWVQFKDVYGFERTLLDSQVIYIKYEDSGVVGRTSYVERLIRPFNIYRIVEQAQIIWTVTQSSFKTMFTIPVAGMNRARGMQTLNEAMNRYKEDISFNGDTGELKVNGKTNMPFNKEFWMPENENGTPQIETLTDQGPSLSDNEQLRYFESKLYKMSKIPGSRFDKDTDSTWFGTDASSQLRDEINFSRFVTRIRNNFSKILLKPLQIQVALSIPSIKNDKRILGAIALRFNSYNQFTELMEAEIDIKRIEHIQTLKDTFTSTDEEGNESSYFCDKFLIIKYLKMSDADLELNEKYKLELKNKNNKADDNKSDSEDELDDNDIDDSGENSEENNEEPEDDNSSSEIDSEMTGDVQPESSETTEA